MPLEVKNEPDYRRTQRQLGEIQVALRLTNSIFKDDPNVDGARRAVEGLLSMKRAMFDKILHMEAGE